jgi:hydroxyethylthiazole kinase
MLTSIITAFCVANSNNILEATAAAVVCEGLAGEIAYKKIQIMKAGTSTFRTCLIDAISLMTDKMIREGMKVEVR